MVRNGTRGRHGRSQAQSTADAYSIRTGEGTGVEAYSREAALEKSQARRKHWSRRKKVVVGIVCALAVVLIGAGTAFGLYLNKINSNLQVGDPNELKALQDALAPTAGPDDPYYALLLGSDSRDPNSTDGSRSDTIMLVRVDPANKQVSIISIPRDTQVQIAGHGTQKINAAFAFGQEAGAVEAVNNLCGVSINHYAEIDFDGVVNLVDTLGGVDVNVPQTVNLDGVTIPAGEQHLDGAHALIFSRCRTFAIGDFQRMQDQRILLTAVAKKILDAPVTQIPGLLDSLSSCVTTDVSVTDAASMLIALQGMDPSQMQMATAPAYTQTQDGVSYVLIQQPQFDDMMTRFKQGLPPLDPDTDYSDVPSEQAKQ
jgi:LCP family protein required for cell wall assembly